MKVRELTFAVCAGLLVAGAAAAQDAKPGGQADVRGTEGDDGGLAEVRHSRRGPQVAGRAWSGTWDAEVTSWMDPASPRRSRRASSENRMVLGGRWVESKFTSNMMGMPFEGIGYTGYDNHKKKYMGTWQDNMSTAVMVSEGTLDAAGKVMTSTSTMDDFMTGKKQTIKMTTTIVDPDHHVFEMWGPDPSGKDVKQMEIHYRRRK